MNRFRTTFDYLAHKSVLRALRHRNYAMVELIGWFSIAGTWIQRVAMGWLAWELSHSGAWLGAISLAEAAPAIIFAPLAGVYSDRFDRITVGRAAQIGLMVVSSVLAVVTIGGWITIWGLFFLNMAMGIVGAFWGPVRLAIVPSLVPREDVSSAIALHSILFNVARFVGPALAAPVIAFWGAGWAFAIDSVSYSAYLFVLLVITMVNPDKKAAVGGSVWADTWEGIRYVYDHAALRYIVLLAIVMNVLMRAYAELFPGIADAVFSRGAEGLATLVSVSGAGAMLGAFWVGTVSNPGKLLRGYFLSLGGIVLFLILFALTQTFWMAVVCAVILGAALTSTTISAQVMVQTTVKGEMRGRTMSLWGLINRSGPGLGALTIGWASSYVGFQWPLVAAALASAAICAYVYVRQGAVKQALIGAHEVPA